MVSFQKGSKTGINKLLTNTREKGETDFPGSLTVEFDIDGFQISEEPSRSRFGKFDRHDHCFSR